MKFLVGAIILVIVVFFAVPMAVGGSVNTCQALEKHVVSTQASNIVGGTSGPVYNTINNAGQSAATGQIASTMMAQNHPQAPTGVSCTYYFWKSMVQ
jgi:hypothetical protein